MASAVGVISGLSNDCSAKLGQINVDNTWRVFEEADNRSMVRC